MNLSKSRYCLGTRCLKDLWLSIYKPDEAKDMGNDVVLESGNKVGELARSLFGDYVLIEYIKDKQIMINGTKKYLEDKPKIICEASFNYDGNYCAVDILKNDKDGVEIYEVKSSTEVRNINIEDVSYQTWVLQELGLKVKKSFLVHVNSKYVKNGELNLKEYFCIEDVTSLLDNNVEEKVKELKNVINSDKEPNMDLSMNCKKSNKVSYDCPFFEYCTKHLPKPNVFDLGWRLSTKKKLGFYHKGIIEYSDLLNNDISSKVKTQIEHELYKQSPKIDKIFIDSFMNNLKYPLYFLDFESVQLAIPEIDGTKPYQQLCFQYSLHIMDEKGKITHKEFLSENYNGDFVLELCEHLIKDIPLNSCILVYNKSFEVPRLKEMSNMYKNLSKHLLDIADNIIDLADIFSTQSYYIKNMGGSYSIKKVLPALFPNDPSLDYHNLEQVHKGDEASNAFLSLKDLSKEEQEVLRHNMLKYCCLDTYAMVKIYEKLRSL